MLGPRNSCVDESVSHLFRAAATFSSRPVDLRSWHRGPVDEPFTFCPTHFLARTARTGLGERFEGVENFSGVSGDGKRTLKQDLEASSRRMTSNAEKQLFRIFLPAELQYPSSWLLCETNKNRMHLSFRCKSIRLLPKWFVSSSKWVSQKPSMSSRACFAC